MTVLSTGICLNTLVLCGFQLLSSDPQVHSTPQSVEDLIVLVEYTGISCSKSILEGPSQPSQSSQTSRE